MIFINKNLPVASPLFYSSHLVNINHTHSLNMNHLHFLHFPTIFNHFQNSIFLFFVKAALFFEVIFSLYHSKAGSHFVLHLFSNRSHVMSEYGK